eukprot:gene27803-31405_t
MLRRGRNVSTDINEGGNYPDTIQWRRHAVFPTGRTQMAGETPVLVVDDDAGIRPMIVDYL